MQPLLSFSSKPRMMGEPRRVVLVFASVRSVGDAEGACFFPDSFMVRGLDLHGVDICAIGCSLFLPFVSLSSSSVLSISPFAVPTGGKEE